MCRVNLDLVAEFAKSQNLYVQKYTDPAIKATPSRYVYNVIDNNCKDPKPSKFYLDVNCLSLTFVNTQTKNIIKFNKQWRSFLMNTNIDFANSILEEINHNIKFINNNIYNISIADNLKIRNQKIAELNQIKHETYDFLNSYNKNL